MLLVRKSSDLATQEIASLRVRLRIKHSREDVLSIFNGCWKLIEGPFPVINTHDEAAGLSGEKSTERCLF
jgi:hypothetical protein